jgi:predicted nucleic acid-binding protein
VNWTQADQIEREPKDAKYVDLAIGTKADFLVTRDNDLLDLRKPDSPLVPVFEELDLQFKIVDPFEMLRYFCNSSIE